MALAMGANLPNLDLAASNDRSRDSFNAVVFVKGSSVKELLNRWFNRNRGKKEDNVDVVTVTQVDTDTYAVLMSSTVADRYDGQGFVTDPGIDRYMGSQILGQIGGNQRFELHAGDPRLRTIGVLPRPTGLPCVEPFDKTHSLAPLGSSVPGLVPSPQYSKLGSTSPSKRLSYIPGQQDVISVTPRRQRLAPDDYHRAIADINTTPTLDFSEYDSSLSSSLIALEQFAGEIEHPSDYDEMIAQITRENSSEMRLALIAHDGSIFQDHVGTRPVAGFRLGDQTCILDGTDSNSLSSLSINTHNSVASFTFGELVAKHPSLKEDLEALKKCIEEHNARLCEDKDINIKHLEHQIRSMSLTIGEKDIAIAHTQELLENSILQIDAADAKVEGLKKQLHQAESSRDSWEHEYKMAVGEIDIQRRDHANKLVNLEREKRTIVQKSQYLAERLETEKIRAEGAERAKEVAMAASEGMRKHFDFYRNYYEAQAGLHSQYFGHGNKSLASRPATPKSYHAQVMPAASEIKENEDLDGAVKQAADILRERYREMLEKSDVAEPMPVLRGFEFLAYVERGGDNEENAAGETETTDDDNDGQNIDESRVASQVDGAATFNPSFMASLH